MAYSHTTERKLRIINSTLGEGWELKNEGKSIDAVYNEISGDNRKNLFCKVSPDTKEKVDIMTSSYNIKMSNFIEQLIISEWNRYENQQKIREETLINNFSG